MRLLLCVGARAWWDQGHMLTAAVMEHTLRNHEPHYPWLSELSMRLVESFNVIFQDWKNDYPNFSDIITAATWADHIKCSNYSNNCATVDAIEIFNHYHFVDLNLRYNDTNPLQTLTELAQIAIRQPNNLLWLLSQIQRTMNRQEPQPLFIHCFGDLHQPLHAIDRIGWGCMPLGDHGATRIPTKTNSTHMSLHELWDSAGGTLPEQVYDYSVINARSDAEQLIQIFPSTPSTFNPTSFISIAAESGSIAAESIYFGEKLAQLDAIPELDTGKFCPTATHPYVPSKDYVFLVSNTSLERITLAGYRLAHYLVHMSEGLSGDIVAHIENRKFNAELIVWRSATVTSSLIALVIWVYQAKKLAAAIKHHR